MAKYNGTSKDNFYGGTSAADTILGNGGDDWLQGAGGNDTIRGGTGNDYIEGGKGSDSLFGDSGNDAFVLSSGTDTVDGGSGVDAISFDGSKTGITLQVGAKSITVTDSYGTGKTTFTGIEGFIGSRFNDRITGSAAADIIEGNDGKDILSGGKGADLLSGGQGSDTLTGGSGKDFFEFEDVPGKSNIDTITDFNHADDGIMLWFETFDAVDPSGSPLNFMGQPYAHIKAGQFAANATGKAAQSDDRIIYETDTGKLFYDADGKGGAAGIQFAKLNAHLNLTADDIFLA